MNTVTRITFRERRNEFMYFTATSGDLYCEMALRLDEKIKHVPDFIKDVEYDIDILKQYTIEKQEFVSKKGVTEEGGDKPYYCSLYLTNVKFSKLLADK